MNQKPSARKVNVKAPKSQMIPEEMELDMDDEVTIVLVGKVTGIHDNSVKEDSLFSTLVERNYVIKPVAFVIKGVNEKKAEQANK